MRSVNPWFIKTLGQIRRSASLFTPPPPIYVHLVTNVYGICLLLDFMLLAIKKYHYFAIEKLVIKMYLQKSNIHFKRENNSLLQDLLQQVILLKESQIK